MTLALPIITIDEEDPRLREVCPEVEDPTALEGVVSRLLCTLLGHPDAAGLAAPQVGIQLRIIAVRADFGHNNRVSILINPVIDKRVGWRMVKEGCLSIPGRAFTVQRAQLVRVHAMNEKGEAVCIAAQHDILAQTLEHEIDHLDGVLISDKGVEWKPVLM